MDHTLGEHSSTFSRIVVIAVFVIAFVTIVSCGFRKKPSTVVKDLIRTIERGEIDQAVTYNSQGFTSRNGIDYIKESFRQTALWIKRDGGIKSIEVLKEDTVGDVAEVTMKITRGGGDSSVVYYKLIWENGDWKIDGVASDPTLPAPSATPSVSLWCPPMPHILGVTRSRQACCFEEFDARDPRYYNLHQFESLGW